ncbi:MAG: cyclic nucleotide-binding domain-containing protein [Planctomycetales bacterium]|nr:cyclic nucleotide-binding domain-containing protein [Planctomycetales bacterium]
MPKTNSDSPAVAFAALRELATLSELSDAAVRQLATVGEVQTLSPGTVLFQEGEQHAWIYLLCSGSIRLEMLTTNCGQQTILSVGCGDFLAWSSLLGDGRMTATAVVAEETKLVAMAAGTLQQLLETDSSLGFQIMRALAEALARRLLATRLQLLDLYQP